jgi:hypothetical protein
MQVHFSLDEAFTPSPHGLLFWTASSDVRQLLRYHLDSSSLRVCSTVIAMEMHNSLATNVASTERPPLEAIPIPGLIFRTQWCVSTALNTPTLHLDRETITVFNTHGRHGWST